MGLEELREKEEEGDRLKGTAVKRGSRKTQLGSSDRKASLTRAKKVLPYAREKALCS
jgi:hypothetical protein